MAQKQPAFAMAAGLAALRWISRGYGYEITGADVLDAGRLTQQAAINAGVDPTVIREQIGQMTAQISPSADFVKNVLQAI